jgi:hypothetical protein
MLQDFELVVDRPVADVAQYFGITGREGMTAAWDFIRSNSIWRRPRQMTDAIALRMFSRGIIVGLFIGLYIGWAF